MAYHCLAGSDSLVLKLLQYSVIRIKNLFLPFKKWYKGFSWLVCNNLKYHKCDPVFTKFLINFLNNCICPIFSACLVQ